MPNEIYFFNIRVYGQCKYLKFNTQYTIIIVINKCKFNEMFQLHNTLCPNPHNNILY